MIIVNILAVHTCFRRRKTRPVLLFSLFFFTFLLISLSYLFLRRSSQFGNGNGLFVLVGFLYLPLFLWLYRERFIRILSVICTSWIYTMFVFVLSIHIEKMIFHGDVHTHIVLLIQTLLYFFSAVPFLHVIRTKFVRTLQCILPLTEKYLAANSICWFLTVILVNLSYIYPAVYFLKVVCLAFLLTDVILSFMLLYHIVTVSRTMQNLRKVMHIDPLTGLPNRAELFDDAQCKIEMNAPFSVIFMDLDQFKSVNDRYGHLAGDRYLCFFAEKASERLGKSGKLYRFSGDEFICICDCNDKEDFICYIVSGIPPFLPQSEIPFLGVSYGVADYPESSESFDQLLHIADENMYRNKNSIK